MVYITDINEKNYQEFKSWADSKKVYNELPKTIDFSKNLFAFIDVGYCIFFYEEVTEHKTSDYTYITFEDLLKL